MQGIDDTLLFEIAQKSNAILLTTDRDFYHTVPLAYADHFGVIVIALKQPNRESILARLHWVIDQNFMTDLQNTVILLRDQTYRIRQNS